MLKLSDFRKYKINDLNKLRGGVVYPTNHSSGVPDQLFDYTDFDEEGGCWLSVNGGPPLDCDDNCNHCS